MKNKKIQYIISTVIVVNALFLFCFIGLRIYHSLQNKQVKGISTYQALVTDPVDQISQLINKGDLLSATEIKTYSADEIDNITKVNYPSFSRLPSRYEVTSYAIRFYSNDENSKPITLDADVLLPIITGGKKAPLIVFAPNATGLGDSCSSFQSYQQTGSLLINELLSYATQGYIIIIPNYEKIDTPHDVYPFYNAQLESHEMLDAGQAGFNLLTKVSVPTKPQNAVFLAGFDEGGNAAFAGKDNLYEYAPNLPVRGIIGIAPMTNVLHTIQDNPDLAPYILYSYEKNYGDKTINVSQLLQDKWLGTLQNDANMKCVGDFMNYYGTHSNHIFSDSFNTALQHNTMYQTFPELNALFQENSSGLRPSKLPTLIVQGTADSQVTIADQTDFLKNACDIQNNIALITYEEIDHQKTLSVSFKDIFNWMGNVLNGDIPASICSKLQVFSSQ